MRNTDSVRSALPTPSQAIGTGNPHRTISGGSVAATVSGDSIRKGERPGLPRDEPEVVRLSDSTKYEHLHRIREIARS